MPWVTVVYRSHLILTEPTREKVIASAITVALNDAAKDGEPVEIRVCIGEPCEGNAGGCELCELITCHPNGVVGRPVRRN